jgi:hypothetical protein
MTKKVFNLNNTIPHSVRLVDPFLFYFASAMRIVSLTAKAMATTTAMATAMIDHRLFHDSNKTIVGITYFSSFSWWNGERICWQWRKWKEWEEEVVVVFCNGNDNGYADNNCNGNDDGNDYRLFLESDGMIAAILYIFFLYSMRMQGRICWQQR